MDEMEMDVNRELMLDGNSVGGIMHELFAMEMTATPAECANCGNKAEIGALLAFTQAPGLIMRCPVCESIVMRIVETPDAIYLDARGAASLRIERRPR
jgi:Zn finger protein HypA/HybF involved in hydrogenase expression